jgi:hypothetical protein
VPARGHCGSALAANTLWRMAEALTLEQVPARLAQIREQMKLLADYL